MKNMKKDKGITLVALIITIVLLIVLSTVAISSIKNHNIISHVTNITDTYNNKVLEEDYILKNYVNYLEIKPCNHEWEERTIQPTCIKTGLKSVVCIKCGVVLSEEEIDKLGHEYTDKHVAPEHLKNKATCTTVPVYYISCKRCDKNSSSTFTSGSELGHLFDDGKETISPTCTTDGKILFTCTRDGCNYTETNIISALGHLMDSGEETKTPTCTTEGEYTYTCTRSGCSYTETVSIPALGHLIGDTGIIINTATCVSRGKVRLECERIGCNYEIDVYTDVDPDNHSFTNYETNTPTKYSWKEHDVFDLTVVGTVKEVGTKKSICDYGCGLSNIVEEELINDSVMLSIGETIKGYDVASKGLNDPGWFVLGAASGTLKICSNNLSNEETLNYTDYLNNGEDLNNICKEYVLDKYATNARSITVEDINGIAGYSPARRSEVRYYRDGSYLYYKVGSLSAVKSKYNFFMHPDGRIVSSSGVSGITLTPSYYMYYTDTLTSSTADQNYNTGIGFGTKASAALSGKYWLASTFIADNVGYLSFGVRYVEGRGVDCASLWDSNKNESANASKSKTTGVRAVVYLKDTVCIDSDGNIL